MDEFETLMASSRTAVERWLKAHMGNCTDAEDILQDTCLAAFQGFSGLHNKASFLPWILGIARRKCADWYRAQARNRTVLVDHLPEQEAIIPDESYVEETLNELPDRDRLMLRLFYQEMLSQKQISMGILCYGVVSIRMIGLWSAMVRNGRSFCLKMRESRSTASCMSTGMIVFASDKKGPRGKTAQI